ncbi:MAG: hypothetical protein EA406_02750 [Rhodospirillales bacterium]|nr:MAG: hypothetical protein EA406_02750 [Rhodospirillales bacterium]
MTARFSIGIDLGTTNSALAFLPLEGEAASEVLLIPQWETLGNLCEVSSLPSFLYLPEDAVADQLQGREAGRGEWVVGRLARRRAGESTGRVAHSAKSWLCHHGADRTAPFLPWGSDAIPPERKISPIRAAALILNYFKGVWDDRFAAAGRDFRFDAQEVTVTVPASFDAIAQRLTLAAAEEAGFPGHVRLLEEPQAAFYAWLERHDATQDLWQRLPAAEGGIHHVLVVDIGGGTSDFSLFEIRRGDAGGLPGIRRVAVSDHILLGGDNIDLAIAHRLERKLAGLGETLSGAQWEFLVARARDLKERALAQEGAAEEVFPLALPSRGAGLMAGSLSTQLNRQELEEILFDGFFPDCPAGDRPHRAHAALKEWGLPFAADSAVTRHLADFLRDRPPVDAVLFNGGTLYPASLRARLADQIARWQGGAPVLVLDNPEPDLAVARGAARFGRLAHRRGRRIEADTARAVFIAAHRQAEGEGERPAAPALVCVLPQGAQPEQTFAVAGLDLKLRVNRPVRWQAYTSTRHRKIRAGEVVDWNPRDFVPLPPLETTARLADAKDRDGERVIPVTLTARTNELGLLQLACESTDPEVPQSWPLDFNLRAHEGDDLGPAAAAAAAPPPAEPNVAPDALDAAADRLQALFTGPRRKGDKLTAARAFRMLESALGRPKGDWNWVVVRRLWPALEAVMPARAASVEHEETWLILAGFLLRPGFGAPGDEARIDSLWRVRDQGLRFPGKRIRLQEHILWRRVAGGLDKARQERLLAAEIETVRKRTDASPELIQMLGALERISHDAKAELVSRFTDKALDLISRGRHATPYLAALGLLLNRTPLYAGPDAVVSPELVERAFSAFQPLDWSDPALAELQTLFLRAARVTGNRSLDLPSGLRGRIATRLEKAGVGPQRVAKVRDFIPVEQSERPALFGESLPPGLVLGSG